MGTYAVVVIRSRSVRRAQQVGCAAAVILTAGLWLPWGSLELFSFPVATVNGQEIGSGIVNLPVGWITAACGVIAGLGAYKSRPGIVLLGGLAALLLVGYAFVAIPGQEYAENINGGAGIPVDLGDPIQVGYAWGIFVLLGAAITLVTTGGVMRSHER